MGERKQGGEIMNGRYTFLIVSYFAYLTLEVCTCFNSYEKILYQDEEVTRIIIKNKENHKKRTQVRIGQ